MKVQELFDPATFTLTYVVFDEESRDAVVIDPVLDYDPAAGETSTGSLDAVDAFVEKNALQVRAVLETHAHADHLSASQWLKRVYGAKIGIGAKITEVQKTFIPLFEADDVQDDGRVFDHLLAEGDSLPLGDLTIAVLHTPGHTPACVTYLIGDAAFVGDTLFMPDYGTARADFPGGDAATLYRSIRRIMTLPPETRVFVGHDYLPAGRDRFRWETSVAEEKALNVHAHEGVSEAGFVEMRQARDATLAPPTLILPSLQVNIRGGALPQPTASGRIFLRLPVTFA